MKNEKSPHFSGFSGCKSTTFILMALGQIIRFSSDNCLIMLTQDNLLQSWSICPLELHGTSPKLLSLKNPIPCMLYLNHGTIINTT
jgi:hypothetical protein